MTGPHETNGQGFPKHQTEYQERQAEEPEVVILDGNEGSAGPEGYSDLADMANLKIPWIMRVIFLVLVGVAGFWLFFSGVCWLLCGTANAASAFKVEDLGRLTRRFWRGVKRSAACTLGFAVSVFSPPLGLSIIMLYFMLHEEGDSAMAQMLRSNVNRYSA